MADAVPDITELLRAWCSGDASALDRLTPQVYRELHKAASRCLHNERDGHTLQTTDLVNELYVRLNGMHEIDWQNRAHFFALCARQMRRILTDQARARRAAKRGSGAEPVSIEGAAVISAQSCADVLAVDQALNALAKVDARKAQVVELRFFGGLSVEEAAEILNVSPETVTRDWRLAKAWLARALHVEGLDGS